jgi:hypothetical protein
VAVRIQAADTTLHGNFRHPTRNLVEYYDENSGLYQIIELGKSRLSGDLSDDEIEEIESVLTT